MPHYAKFGAQDSRDGLGYGLVVPRFHVQRSLQSTYPYTDEDPYEFDLADLEDDEDTLDAIGHKVQTGNYMTNDPLAIGKVNPFYYAAGNTKLSDCFWRTDAVLAEVETLARSMTPIPQLYKKKGLGTSGTGFSGNVGHAQYLTPGNYRRTGTLQGWSHAPPDIVNDEEEDADLAPKTLSDLLLFLQKRSRGEA